MTEDTSIEALADQAEEVARLLKLLGQQQSLEDSLPTGGRAG